MSEKDNENEKEQESECFINIIKFLILGNQEGSVEFCSLLFAHLCRNGSCGDKLGAISALSTLIRVEPFRTVRILRYRDLDTVPRRTNIAVPTFSIISCSFSTVAVASCWTSTSRLPTSCMASRPPEDWARYPPPTPTLKDEHCQLCGL